MFLIICCTIIFIFYIIIYFKIQNKKIKKQEEIKLKELEEKLNQEKIYEELLRKQKKEQHEKYIIKCKKDFTDCSNKINKVDVKVTNSLYKKRSLTSMPELKFSTIRKNSSYKDIVNFVVIDVETTGLRYQYDDIIEISAIKFIDREPVEFMSSLINPNESIPSDATTINNITDEMVKNSPKISNIIDSFSSFISGFNLVRL